MTCCSPPAATRKAGGRPGYTQPALYALECALAALWRSWGIEPVALLGHSVGEYAAAQVAGVFDLEAGLRLVAARGRLMQALGTDGAMAAVFASEMQVLSVLDRLDPALSVAAVNAPDEVVLSGGAAALEAAVLRLTAAGLTCRRLNVSQAFHSPLLDPMLGRFAAIAAETLFAPPAIPLVSNVTGELVAAAAMCSAGLLGAAGARHGAVCRRSRDAEGAGRPDLAGDRPAADAAGAGTALPAERPAR